MPRSTDTRNVNLVGPILGSVGMKTCEIARDGLKLRDCNLESFIIHLGPPIDSSRPPKLMKSEKIAQNRSKSIELDSYAIIDAADTPHNPQWSLKFD